MYDSKDLKDMASAVRNYALGAILNAHSGHVGIVLGAADVVTAIYANVLRRDADKFVLSAGHGSALLYAALALSGYELPDLKTFRKVGGLPGHPEFGIPGVAVTTGPLGQGIGNAVGMAMAAKLQKNDGHVYCLCSDGDLMEGVAQESIAFAGRYGLDNLTLVWDDNGVSIDGAALTDIDVPARFAAAGWDVVSIDGHNFKQIDKALRRRADGRPVFVQSRTVLGRGSSVAGTSRAHGYGVSEDELVQLRDLYKSARGAELWNGLADVRRGGATLPAWPVPDLSGISITDTPGDKISTRELSGKFLARLLAHSANLIVGSADLGGSTNVKSESTQEIKPGEFIGNYINYGVREHAMGAIMNGMAAVGLRPVGSTFLVFSDYVRPSIRLAALSGWPVVYVFTHDSIAVGEDGPTHQPIEQLPSLRLMPNLNVFRPCNGAEVATAWTMALTDVSRPSCMILSRQKIEQIPIPDGAEVDLMRGGYVIYPATARNVRITLIATGSEVPLAVSVAKKLGGDVQVVSMPSVATFRAQDTDYQHQVLRGYVVAIEASAAAPWFEFADAVVGIDDFGMSGDGDAVYAKCGFDADLIAHQIERWTDK